MKIILAAVAAVALCVAAAGAKNLVKELRYKDAGKRAAAAAELAARARAQGLSGEEVEALAAAVNDADDDVRTAAVAALAANSAIATSREYAPRFARRGDNFISFLLWYAVYQTYAALIEDVGGAGPGDMAEEMASAKSQALEAYANMLDPERKSWAEPYYQNIAP